MLLFLSFVGNDVNRGTSVSSSARGLPKSRKRRATAELKENQMFVFSNVKRNCELIFCLKFSQWLRFRRFRPDRTGNFFYVPSTIVKQVQDYLTITNRKTKLKINVTVTLAATVIFKTLSIVA